MHKACKVCGELGSTKWVGRVCWACFLEDQRAWRGTTLGRAEANEAAKAYRARKRVKAGALKDA